MTESSDADKQIKVFKRALMALAGTFVFVVIGAMAAALIMVAISIGLVYRAIMLASDFSKLSGRSRLTRHERDAMLITLSALGHADTVDMVIATEVTAMTNNTYGPSARKEDKYL